MLQYVNDEKFLAWYRAAAAAPAPDVEILSRVYADYCDTRCAEYVLPAEDTVSGREERYAFRVETVGCCGACTVFLHF